MFEQIIRQYLGDYLVTLPNATGNQLARCPFHKNGNERHPSLSINVRTGLAYCFTCGRGWNIYTLLKELGINALIAQEIARRHNVDLEVTEPKETVLPEWIISAWKRNCPQVLIDQGYQESLLRAYEVGWDADLRAIVFPIRNVKGELVAVQGRRIDSSQRYFFYTPYLSKVLQKPVYSYPKKHLWNMHRLYRRALNGLDTLVIVEGIKKALWLIQHGFDFTVSSLSCNVSEAQIALLRQLQVKRIVVMFDNDKPGQQGAATVVEQLPNAGMPVWRSDKTQPDELTKDEIEKMIFGELVYF